MICNIHGVRITPPTEQTTPRITATVQAVRMEQCIWRLSPDPQCPEIRIVAPVARPFMKFRGNLNNVCTESIAARPSFPVNCPTTTASMVTYSCWIRLPAMIGSTNSRIPLLTFPFVSVCFSILFPSLDCGIKIPRACKFLQII